MIRWIRRNGKWIPCYITKTGARIVARSVDECENQDLTTGQDDEVENGTTPLQ